MYSLPYAFTEIYWKENHNTMILKLYAENPNERHVLQVVKCLEEGGIVALPTDSIYAFACDLKNIKAAEKMAAIKKRKLEKALFSVCCSDFSLLSECTKPIPTPLFRRIKQFLPGPYTLILQANHNVPRTYQTKKKTIGIRVVDNAITQAIIKQLGNPVMVTTVKDVSYLENYLTDPEIIQEQWGDRIDMVVDGGICSDEPTTVLDCTQGTMEVVREGKGKID